MLRDATMDKATWISIVCAMLMVAGCKNKMFEAAETYEKEACACKDAPCATAAATRFAEQATKYASAPAPKDAAYRAAVQKATECVAALTLPKLPPMPNMSAVPSAPAPH